MLCFNWGFFLQQIINTFHCYWYHSRATEHVCASVSSVQSLASELKRFQVLGWWPLYCYCWEVCGNKSLHYWSNSQRAENVLSKLNLHWQMCSNWCSKGHQMVLETGKTNETDGFSDTFTKRLKNFTKNTCNDIQYWLSHLAN